MYLIELQCPQCSRVYYLPNKDFRCSEDGYLLKLEFKSIKYRDNSNNSSL